MIADRLKVKLAVYLIPRRNGEVLLSLRQNTGWMDGHYSLVAGHVEAGETAKEAMIREAEEEAGATLLDDDLKFVHVLYRMSNESDDNYIDIFFESERWDGEFVNAEPNKCGGLEWFKIDDLPVNTLSYVKDVIEMSERKIYYSSRRGA